MKVRHREIQLCVQKYLGSSLALHVCFVVHCKKAFADYENSYNSFAIAGSNATYDYIVIGGGTAGNVLRHDLLKVQMSPLLSFEAGRFYQIESGDRSVVPIYARFNLALPPHPLTDWGFNMENMAGAANQSFRYPWGKTLGCSSALNYMT